MKLSGLAWSVTGLVALVGATALLVPKPVDVLEAHARDPDPKVAIPALETQRQAAPTDDVAPTRLAAAYVRAGKPIKAVGVLAETGKLRPLTREERAAVKRTALAAGRPELALAVLSGPHEPYDRKSREEVVAVALASGKTDLALWHQKQLADRFEEPDVLAKLREIAVMAGHLDTAVDSQQRLVSIAPTSRNGQKLVDLLLESGEAGGALLAMERHVPVDGVAWRMRAMELAEWAGDHGRAATHGTVAYLDKPDQALGKQVVNHLNAAKLVDRAADLATDMQKRWPEDAEIRKLHRTMLAAAGRMEELEALLRADFAAAPNDPDAVEALTDHLLAQGDRGEAIAELNKFSVRNPVARGVRIKLARVLTWDGKMEEARGVYVGLHRDAPGGAADRPWREAWLGISRPVDDATREGLANLKALVAIDGKRLEWRRRLAAAHLEVGDLATAIKEQRALCADARAGRADRLALADWLAWAEKPVDSLAVLHQELERAPLPEDVLRTAVERAAQVRRWTDATRFLQALTVLKPRSGDAWEMLASAREAAGDLGGAAEAWHKRNRLDGSDPNRRLTEASLQLRAGRPRQALAALQERPAKASVAELRYRAALADRMGLLADEVVALRGVVAKKPNDPEIHVALAGTLERMGKDAEAAQALDRALALRPDDQELLVAVAGKHVYGREPEKAAPLVARLAGLPRVGGDGLRVVADYYETRDAGRAAQALDRIHAAESGDAGTWFRRGELAASARDGVVAVKAFERAASMGKSSGDAAFREAGAYALQRLGREDEALAAWKAIARAFPSRPGAPGALARLYLARGDLAGADDALTALEHVEPRAGATKLLRGEYLVAVGRGAEAAEVLAGVPPEDPDAPFAAAAEALARHHEGDFKRAHKASVRAIAARPDDFGVQDLYRLTREGSADRLGARVSIQNYAGLDRQKLFATGLKRWGDRLSLHVEAGRVAFGGAGSQEVGATLAAEGGSWRVSARGAAATPLDPATSAAPVVMGRLEALAHGYGLEVKAHAAQERWEEVDAAARAGGLERSVGAEVAWRPIPQVGMLLAGQLGRVGLNGYEAGVTSTMLAEASVTPGADSPWTARYQYRHRAWNDAGPKVGLPTALPFHTGAIVYAGRAGKVRYEVAPGALQDLASRSIAPVVSGGVSVDLGHDAELNVSAGWGGRAVAIGTEGTYKGVEVNGAWHF